MSAKTLSGNSSAQLLSRKSLEGKRTWIEISRDAIRNNVRAFRKLVGPRVKLWSAVKSNAYGHGLYTFVPEADKAGVDGFCVDSIIEAKSLRRIGIRKPMLVLGATLPGLLQDAAARDIAVSVSNFDTLEALGRLSQPPKFHIKVDTGMHRQGFAPNDLVEVIRRMSKSKFQISKEMEGIFTHFAAAGDLHDTRYTDMQLARFEEAVRLFERAGFRNLVRHVSATGGTLMDKRYHQDAVRVGIGLYGLWPSPELKRARSRTVCLKPVLSWRTVVTEFKRIETGDRIGYDLTERARRPTTIAVLPVGYWHGFPRALSSVGEVLIRGKRAKVLGRVSMDMIVVDATNIRVRVGDKATMIGRDGGEVLTADDVARLAGTVNYELVTRLNPLMERIVV